MKHFRLIALSVFLGKIISDIFRKGQKFSSIPKMHRIEVYGHRGEAGHYPENTIPGFLSAVQKGVDAIEMDVVISKDRKVVVSHEPFMASHYVLDAQGQSISKLQQRRLKLYQMNYEEIQKFDTGSKKNRSFPKQKKIHAYKPLLETVFDTIEKYRTTNNFPPVKYMIEVKSSSWSYNRYQPEPAEFVALIMEVIQSRKLENRVIVKSFDPQILNELHAKHPTIATSYLVSKIGVDWNLARLNFTPTIYSPRHRLIRNQKFVNRIHSRNMKLVPWTVNNRKSIKRMIRLGVDGIISDYPERVFEELKNQK